MTQENSVEMMAYDEYCMEIFLQWLQVRKQQSLNLAFAKPSNYNEGELAAYNGYQSTSRVIPEKLLQFIIIDK